MTALDGWAGNNTYGIEALLFIADIALALGAKNEVRFLLLVWLVIFGFWIFLSIVVPPALILIGWVFTTYARNIKGVNYFTVVLSYVTNIKSFDQNAIFFLSYHLITFVLGVYYLYIWFCARSLYKMIAPVTRVHILPGHYREDKF